MRASAAQKATTHGKKTEVGAAPEVAAAAAGQVEGVEDGKILLRMDKDHPENQVNGMVQDRMEKVDKRGSEKKASRHGSFNHSGSCSLDGSFFL